MHALVIEPSTRWSRRSPTFRLGTVNSTGSLFSVAALRPIPARRGYRTGRPATSMRPSRQRSHSSFGWGPHLPGTWISICTRRGSP